MGLDAADTQLDKRLFSKRGDNTGRILYFCHAENFQEEET